jgi:acyl carrier protein
MNTLEVVQEMLMSEFDLTRGQVDPESKLAELGVDSLATIEFLFLLEERFKLDLNSEPVPIVTVADIALEVDRMLARKLDGEAA